MRVVLKDGRIIHNVFEIHYGLDTMAVYYACDPVDYDIEYVAKDEFERVELL